MKNVFPPGPSDIRITIEDPMGVSSSVVLSRMMPVLQFVKETHSILRLPLPPASYNLVLYPLHIVNDLSLIEHNDHLRLIPKDRYHLVYKQERYRAPLLIPGSTNYHSHVEFRP